MVSTSARAGLDSPKASLQLKKAGSGSPGGGCRPAISITRRPCDASRPASRLTSNVPWPIGASVSAAAALGASSRRIFSPVSRYDSHSCFVNTPEYQGREQLTNGGLTLVDSVAVCVCFNLARDCRSAKSPMHLSYASGRGSLDVAWQVENRDLRLPAAGAMLTPRIFSPRHLT